MKKKSMLPGLIESFKSSFYNPDFYKKVSAFPLGKVMGYLLILVTFGYLLTLARGAIFVWQNEDKIREAIGQVMQSYPEEMVLTFEKGILTTNVEEPYFLPTEPFNEVNYAVVIDTKNAFNEEKFADYHAAVWMNQEALYMLKGNSGGFEMIPYPTEKSFTVTKAFLVESAGRIWEAFFPVFMAAAGFGLIFGGLAVFAFYSIYLLCISFVYFIVTKMIGKKRRYAECYRQAVYAMTPVFVLTWLAGVANLWMPFFLPPFLLTTVLFCTLYFNVRSQAPTHRN